MFAPEESSFEKTPTSKVESFLMTLFDLNETKKIVFTKKLFDLDL